MIFSVRSNAARAGSAPARLALVAALCALLAPSGAQAAQLHGFDTSFGEAGAGSGQLSLRATALDKEARPVGAGSALAVDDELDQVYVGDTENHRVVVFDPTMPPTERFVRAFGADVGGAGVDVCTASCKAGTAGTEPGQLQDPTFVAIDNDPASPSHGDVYVADTAGGENRVSKFGPEGELIVSWGSGGQLNGESAAQGPFKEIKGIAVDTAGDLWVQGGQGGKWMFEFGQGGGLITEWITGLGSQPIGTALDGAGRVYVAGGQPWGPIVRFTTSGANLGRVLGSGGVFFTGLAANMLTHDLYVDREGTSIEAVAAACDPSESLCAPTQIFGEGQLSSGAGVATDATNGAVYVASTTAERIDAFAVTLEARSEGAGEVKASSATLHGSVAPKETPVTRCAFQYGLSTSYGQELPCLNGSGEEVGTPAKPIVSPTEVHAGPAGLSGGSSYHFRLRVVNEEKASLSSEDNGFETLKLAKIEAVRAEALSASSAELTAQVDPEGVSGTSCELEWGTSSAYGTTLPCEPPTLGGTSPVAVSVQLSGLAPNTTYHYRFVVTDDNGTERSQPDHTFILLPTRIAQSCANEALREVNNSLGLADCRAYELITPAQKNGALIGALLFNAIPPAIADDGGDVIAPSIQCFAGSPSCVGSRLTEGEPFEFARASTGWQARSLALPAEAFETSSAWRFNANTGAVLFSAPTTPGGQDDWYTRATDGATSDRGALWEGGLTLHTLRALEPEPTEANADLSHILYEMQEPGWAFKAGNGEEGTGASLYEYPGGAGSPQLVGVSGGQGSHDLIGACGESIAGKEILGKNYGSLSEDGRTAYFQVGSCSHGTGTNAGDEVPATEVFARIDGESPSARTVAISQPGQLGQANPACTSAECLTNTSDPHRFRDAEFEGASGDSKQAYFTSTQQLTDEASQDPAGTDSAVRGCAHATGAGGCNLYMFEDPQQEPLSGTHLVDVSAGDSSGLGPEVQGMLAISSDGTHAYFVAEGVLSEAPNAAGQRAAEGSENLYLYERDAQNPQGHTAFIARLSRSDEQEWLHGIGFANVSPDGRYLVFESRRGLTPDARPEGAAQVYRYDAQSGSLSRISFGERGFNDDGNAGGEGADASIVRASKAILERVLPIRPDPTMADDGSRVFFQSPVALTPEALNEVSAGDADLAQNVYEWEAPGLGSCDASETRGCVSLVSDGKDVSERSMLLEGAVELLGADRNGVNVFFATTDRIVPGDTDTQRDYYDARIDGGFPAPSVPQPCADAESCHPGGTVAPLLGPLGSLSFTGPGNLARTQISPPPSVKPKSKPLTRAQKLARALKSCRAKRSKRKRRSCERAARKRYGPKKSRKARRKRAKKGTRGHGAGAKRGRR